MASSHGNSNPSGGSFCGGDDGSREGHTRTALRRGLGTRMWLDLSIATAYTLARSSAMAFPRIKGPAGALVIPLDVAIQWTNYALRI